jgi:hypothetical protein
VVQTEKDDGLKSKPAPENASEPDESPTLKLVKRGLGGGALAGFIAAKLYMESQSVDTPVGTVYEGDVLLVFAVFVGGAAAIGAGLGWLAANAGDDEDVPPPRDL